MNILVNGTPLLAPLTGIGQYIRHLFTAMEDIPGTQVRVFYGTRCEQGLRSSCAESNQNVQRTYSVLKRVLPRPRALRRRLEQAMFAYHSRKNSDEVIYHEPNYVALPYKGPVVLTICDMSCFDHPQSHPKERVALMHRDMPGAIERADHIIVISKASGEALQRWFNVNPDRITTTYLAADSRFYPRSQQTLMESMAKFNLTPGSYVLSVGTLEPRKNLPAMFAAYAGLPAGLRQRFPLVVAGMKGWDTDALMQSAQNLISRGELRLLGYVEDQRMPMLYAGAAAFCYPSRYEGFGLPALEAMASGVPVITSNQTSLPEVVGNAGLMVDPDDVDGMREHLRGLLEDRVGASQLGVRGLARAGTFSWSRCAKETHAVYERVMAQRGIQQ
jgi:glycosyltransferase involved in cell wall biosynthesis